MDAAGPLSPAGFEYFKIRMDGEWGGGVRELSELSSLPRAVLEVLGRVHDAT